MSHLPPILRFVALIAFCAGLTCALQSRAQELHQEAVPYSVWLDFQALSKPKPPKVSLPIWLESVSSDRPRVRKGEPPRTVIRLRLRRVGLLNREVQLRLFFDDQPGYGPSVNGWTETGSPRFQSGPLGGGLGLPTSESVIIPVEDTDYVEVTVPGNGSTLRGAFLTTVRIVETRISLDLGVAERFTEPFGNPLPHPASESDSLLFGRVRATLEAQPLKLSPEAPAEWDIQLDRLPVLAVLTFEVLNIDLTYPPEVQVNGASLGAVTPQLPDLADPGYRGEVRPLETDMRFHYTGWLRCQKVIQPSVLQTGVNSLHLVLGRQTGAVAVRAVSIELKHNSKNLDYTLVP
jgi:hypothetical protein